MFSCEICEISKNTFFYRTPPVTAFVVICSIGYVRHNDISRKSISEQDKLVEFLNLCPKQKNIPDAFVRSIQTEDVFCFFLSTNQQLHNLKQFCFGKCCCILGVDPPFNTCNYNVTISTYRLSLLIDKATEEHPVLTVLSIIHSHKTIQSNFLLPSKYGSI